MLSMVHQHLILPGIANHAGGLTLVLPEVRMRSSELSQEALLFCLRSTNGLNACCMCHMTFLQFILVCQCHAYSKQSAEVLD